MEILTSGQFDLLVDIEAASRRGGFPLQPSRAASPLLAGLLRDGALVREGASLSITAFGLRRLEPYRVRRAIILAAGLGSRLLPLTETTPKPLVTIDGTPIIETSLRAIESAGIPEIILVTGHLASAFEPLRETHPSLRILYNNRYRIENNISSAYLVRDLFPGSYVLDADLFLRNPALIRRYEYRTNYLGVPVPRTDDWCFEESGGRVVGMAFRCGRPCHLMVGISYWTEEAGRTFARDIEKLYATEEGKERFWDEVALGAFNDHYDIRVRECNASDITEVDSIAELVALDQSYRPFVR